MHTKNQKWILVNRRRKWLLTFLATKRTIIKAAAKHPAAILAARRFVDASIKTIPQNDDPRSVKRE